MDLRAYTPDNICRSLGMQGFGNDPGLASYTEAIRILVKPSRLPEFCFTISAEKIAVVAGLRMVWRLNAPAWVPTVRSSFRTPEGLFDTCMECFAEVAASTLKSVVMCDGVNFNCVLRWRGESIEFEGSLGCHGPHFDRFVTDLIRTGLENSPAPQMKLLFGLLLSRGGDVGLYERLEAGLKPLVAVGVIGTESGRAKFLALLEGEIEARA